MNNSCSDELKILIRSSSASEFSLMNKKFTNINHDNHQNYKRFIDGHSIDYDNVNNNSSNSMSVNNSRKK